MPEELKYYKADEESFESSHDVFRYALPRGFAWEVLAVYSGPPVISFKFRHWGYFEGPFKGHAPTGEMVQFYGVGILKVSSIIKFIKFEFCFSLISLKTSKICLVDLIDGTPDELHQ